MAAVAAGRAVHRATRWARVSRRPGAGISKALESGLAAGECAIAALQNGGPDDFTNYAQRMEAAWGREYRRGRYFHKLLG